MIERRFSERQLKRDPPAAASKPIATAIYTAVMTLAGAVLLAAWQEFGSPIFRGPLVLWAAALIILAGACYFLAEKSRTDWRDIPRRRRQIRWAALPVLAIMLLVLCSYLTARYQDAGRSGFSVSANPEFFTFISGSTRCVYSREDLRLGKGVVDLIQWGDFKPMLASMEGDRIVFDGEWEVGDDEPSAIVIRCNKVTVNVPGWDWNWADDDLEVVDARGEPVLQIRRVNASTVRILGVKRKSGQSLLMDEHATFFNTGSDTRGRIRPLFRYPSAQFRGVFASGRTTSSGNP
jgi:hypothetical protein